MDPNVFIQAKKDAKAETNESNVTDSLGQNLDYLGNLSKNLT